MGCLHMNKEFFLRPPTPVITGGWGNLRPISKGEVQRCCSADGTGQFPIAIKVP